MNSVLFIYVAEAGARRNPLLTGLDAQLLIAGHVLVIGDGGERVLVPVFEDGALTARVDRLLEEGVGVLAYRRAGREVIVCSGHQRFDVDVSPNIAIGFALLKLLGLLLLLLLLCLGFVLKSGYLLHEDYLALDALHRGQAWTRMAVS